MSKFYGGKEEDKLDPNISHPDPPKNNEDPTFKKRDDISRDSIFLQKEPKPEPGCCDKCCENCCSCLSLNYYKDYFKVTNKDVTKRIGCNLLFWKGGFFDPPEQEYDLYGPFWLYTTMIFVVGAVHNVLIYQNSPNNYAYDFQVVGIAFTVFYILGLGLSIVIGLIFGCFGLQSKTSQIVCLYGYSMTTYIICVLVCTVNSTLATWILLTYAATTKVIYILRNVFESLDVPAAKKFIIMVIVIAEAAIQFFIIKFAFIKATSSQGFKAAFSHMNEENHFEMDEGVMHFRSFPTL